MKQINARKNIEKGFETVMPKVVMETVSKNSHIGILIIVGTTIIFSLIVIKLSEKLKFLKVLY